MFELDNEILEEHRRLLDLKLQTYLDLMNSLKIDEQLISQNWAQSNLLGIDTSGSVSDNVKPEEKISFLNRKK